MQVLLQAIKEELPPDYKCRDKFLVQSTAITPELESTNISNLWSEVERRPLHQIHERKIRCVFVGDDNSKAVTSSSTNGNNGGVDANNTSPAPEYAAEPPLESSFRSVAQSPAAVTQSTRTSTSQAKDTDAVAPVPGSSSSSVTAAAPRNSTSNSSGGNDELNNAKREIAALRDEIESLKAKARRAAAGVSSTTSPSAQQLQAQGVPVHISAIIALVAFLAAYLLF